MLAFWGQHQLKADTIRQLQAHYEADEIVQGVYWENGKGCAVGCTTHSDDHSEYERQLGIPRQLAYLEDCLFECLPMSKAKLWPMEFIEAIPVGVDLSLVCPEFLHWLLVDPRDGVLQFTEGFPEVRQAVVSVGALFDRYRRREEITEMTWVKAYSAARSAVELEAPGVAQDAAWCATWCAARGELSDPPNARIAGDIAWAARKAQAARPSGAARSTALTRQQKKILELLRACKATP